MSKFCIHCGVENQDNAKFCRGCGAKFEGSEDDPREDADSDNVYSSNVHNEALRSEDDLILSKSIECHDEPFSLFSFSGCVSRKTYWAVSLGLFGILAFMPIIVFLIFGLFSSFSGTPMEQLLTMFSDKSFNQGIITVVAVTIVILSLFINMALSIKRLRDADFSPWLYLLNIIPYLGAFIVLVMNGFFPSAEQNNKRCKSRNNLSPKAATWLHLFFWVPLVIFAILVVYGHLKNLSSQKQTSSTTQKETTYTQTSEEIKEKTVSLHNKNIKENNRVGFDKETKKQECIASGHNWISDSFGNIVCTGTSEEIIEEESLDRKQAASKFLKKLQNYIKNNDSHAISNVVSYPFPRFNPIPIIKTKEEFQENFNYIFDENLKNMILNLTEKDIEFIGWRDAFVGEISTGVALLRFSDDNKKISRINYQTEKEKQLAIKIKELDKNFIHPSIKNYKLKCFEAITKKYKIRIDLMNDSTFRYSAWNKDVAQSEKPNIVIYNGTRDIQGSMGSATYTFINEKYKYNIYDGLIHVYKNDKLLMNQEFIKIILADNIKNFL